MMRLLRVHADYSQYHVFDRYEGPDWSSADMQLDGVIKTFATGISISTGVQWGNIDVEMNYMSPPTEVGVPPFDVAAEADFRLESGVVALSSFEGDLVDEHKFRSAGWVRLRVDMANRDEAATDRSITERHRIWIWRVPEPAGRRRTTTLDRTGQALEQMTPPAF